MVKNYAKKRVIVQAIQFNGDNWDEILEFMNKEKSSNEDYPYIIETLEGTMKVLIGDYVIKGIQGEFYPCKPDIFKDTYEECYE